MTITITHGKKQVALEMPEGGQLKLYQVPAAYSEDRYFAAAWGRTELEPLPGCAQGEATLLAHLSGGQGSMEPALQAIYLKKGVSYAEA